MPAVAGLGTIVVVVVFKRFVPAVLGALVSEARVRTEIRDEMVTAGIEGRLGISEIRLEVDDCVADFLRKHPEAGSSD